MRELNKENTTDMVRDAVLRALDEVCSAQFGWINGATDAELPVLFKTLDAHVEIMAKRNGCILI